MSTPTFPDYDLDDVRIVRAPYELKAMFDQVRGTILELLLERAATVGELAAALRRPKSTVAHHVGVLVDAGMLKVVRTRRVRAIDERFYGRTARLFQVGVIQPELVSVMTNILAHAAVESEPAHQADQLAAVMRHARITREQATDFWARLLALVQEFTQLPRTGDTVYGFAAGIYPTDFPSLPESEDGTA